jgi:hypothetical protein
MSDDLREPVEFDQNGKPSGAGKTAPAPGGGY